MHVTLMRHFKVKYTWKRRYTPQGFRTAQNDYDEADVLDQHIVLENHFQKVIVSDLKRTLLTFQ